MNNINTQEPSHYQKNKLKYNEASRAYYQKHKDRIKEKVRQYNKDNKEVVCQSKKRYYEETKEARIAYYELNRKRFEEIARIRYHENKERLLAVQKQYSSSDIGKEKRRKRFRERYHNEPIYKLTYNIRARVNMALRSSSTRTKNNIIELIGCSIEQLKDHIEKQWTPGMSWDNHTKSGWHIDHIKPCAAYNLAFIEQQKECFNYKNLRPIWCTDNSSKGSMYCGIRCRYNS